MSRTFIISFLLLSLGLIISLPRPLNRPFIGHHEFNAVFYSQIAKNYLRLGLVKTKLAQVTTPINEPFGYHTHHPPFYPLLLAGVFAFTGVTELSARLLSIVAVLIGLFILSHLSYRLSHIEWSPLFLLPLTVIPLVSYYSQMPVFEPLLFTFSCLLLYSLVVKNTRLLYIAAISLILIDWPGYWPVLTFLVYGLFNRSYRQFLKPLFFSLVFATIVILLVQYLSYGHPLRDLLEVGSMRAFAKAYTNLNWLHLLLSRSKAFIGLPILFISAAALLLKKPLLTLSFIFGLLHLFIFRNITWYHDYMLYHLLPFLFLALIYFFNFLFKKTTPTIALTCLMALTLLSFTSTRKFTEALYALSPHRDCYAIAEELGRPVVPPAFMVTVAKKTECPPFITFYADKYANLVVKP